MSELDGIKGLWKTNKVFKYAVIGFVVIVVLALLYTYAG